jgi:hypothetical protein
VSPSRGEVGPPFPCHGPLQDQWPTVGRTHDDGTRAAPRGVTQVAESVGDELEIPNVNGFTEGKTITQ